MADSPKDQLLANLRTSLREALNDLKQISSDQVKTLSIAEALTKPLIQPIPSFSRNIDRTISSRQERVFGLYALRTAIRGHLIALLYFQAGKTTEQNQFLAPTLTSYYAAIYHTLMAVLALRGRVVVETVRGLSDVQMIVGKLTDHNSWVFEPRRKSHEEIWLTLIELMAKEGSALPPKLEKWLEPRSSDGESSPVERSDELKRRIRAILGSRHRALYYGYAFDDTAHDLVTDGDLGAAHALNYKVQGFGALAADMISWVLFELDELLFLRDIMPAGTTRPAILLGVFTPPFEIPSPAIPGGTQDDLAKLSRLFEYLGFKERS